jgi:hypothetical protein
MSGRSPISPSKNSACRSNGEVLPPLGFAAMLPVSSNRAEIKRYGVELVWKFEKAAVFVLRQKP